MEDQSQVLKHAQVLHESLNESFLESGGTLLRRGDNKKGEPIIEQRKKGSKWQKRLTYTKEEFRDKAFNWLTRYDKFLKNGEI